MPDPVLDEVLTVERRLREERQAFEARLTQQYTEQQARAEARVAAETAKLESERTAALEVARGAAEAEAGELLAAARRYTARLDAFEDEALREVVRRHLSLLLPERSDDRPDEQN